jgi:hypothetical protein
LHHVQGIEVCLYAAGRDGKTSKDDVSTKAILVDLIYMVCPRRS